MPWSHNEELGTKTRNVSQVISEKKCRIETYAKPGSRGDESQNNMCEGADASKQV